MSEFILVGGVSDLMRGTNTSLSNMSGVALSIMVEQDDARISVTTDSIKNAIKNLGKHILRIFKQFAVMPRLLKIANEDGNIEVLYFSNSDITSDDIIFETQVEAGDTLAQRRNMVFELLNAGLLYDENGKLSNRMRVKALDLLGFGIWENSQDINELNLRRASSENFKFCDEKKCIEPLEIDDHKLHINEHTAFMLGGEFENKEKEFPELKNLILEHIRKHKKMQRLEEELNINTNYKIQNTN